MWATWTDFARKVTIGLVMITLITTEQRLRLTLIVIAASLSFEAAKQGWAQLILNPGAPNTNPSPFMGDNNGVAVGMFMLVPILIALAGTASRWWEKYIARFLTVGVVYRGLSTYSRGGFLAAMALGLHYLLRTKRKVAGILAIAVLGSIIVPVLPDAFWERMGSIQTGAEATDESQLDVSQAGRLHFWRVAVVMGNDRPVLGVGLEAYNYMYDYYDFRNGAFGNQRSVHSAWFGMLAEVGYVGLGIFVLLISRAFYFTWKARRIAKSRPDLANLVAYGTALEAGLVVFAVGGSFIPHQYNEMLWHFIALSFVFERLVRERIAVPVPVPAVAEPVARSMAWPAQPAMLNRLPGTTRDRR